MRSRRSNFTTFFSKNFKHRHVGCLSRGKWLKYCTAHLDLVLGKHIWSWIPKTLYEIGPIRFLGSESVFFVRYTHTKWNLSVQRNIPVYCLGINTLHSYIWSFWFFFFNVVKFLYFLNQSYNLAVLLDLESLKPYWPTLCN